MARNYNTFLISPLRTKKDVRFRGANTSFQMFVMDSIQILVNYNATEGDRNTNLSIRQEHYANLFVARVVLMLPILHRNRFILTEEALETERAAFMYLLTGV